MAGCRVARRKWLPTTAADNGAGDAVAGVAADAAARVAADAQVVAAAVDDDGAAEDGEGAEEGEAVVEDADAGHAVVVGYDVAQVADVAAEAAGRRVNRLRRRRGWTDIGNNICTLVD